MIPHELFNGVRSCAGAGSVKRPITCRGSSPKSDHSLCGCFQPWRLGNHSTFAGSQMGHGNERFLSVPRKRVSLSSVASRPDSPLSAAVNSLGVTLKASMTASIFRPRRLVIINAHTEIGHAQLPQTHDAAIAVPCTSCVRVLVFWSKAAF
jgi:hypothetical protein